MTPACIGWESVGVENQTEAAMEVQSIRSEREQSFPILQLPPPKRVCRRAGDMNVLLQIDELRLVYAKHSMLAHSLSKAIIIFKDELGNSRAMGVPKLPGRWHDS